MYTNYAYGVQNQTGTSSGTYNLLVTGNADYTGASGVMIKNDITNPLAGKKGTRIFQDNNDNAFLDFRTTATDGAKSFAVRIQDDSAPSSFSNMLTLNKDTVTDTSVYGASVSGRVKASQFYVNQADARAPLKAGVYVGQNNATTGYFNINKGSGSGGFNFQTFNADGTTNKTNLSLKGSGSVQIPYYSTVTTDSQDSETTALAVFDATGNLARGYSQNNRFRGLETRLGSLEGTVVASVPVKVNEIIGRLNTLKVWNTKIADLLMTAVPTTAPTTPAPTTPAPTTPAPTTPVPTTPAPTLPPNTSIAYYPSAPLTSQTLPAVIYRTFAGSLSVTGGTASFIVNSTPPANPPSGYTFFNNWNWVDPKVSTLGYTDTYDFLTTTTNTNDTVRGNPSRTSNNFNNYSKQFFPDSNGKYYFRMTSAGQGQLFIGIASGEDAYTNSTMYRGTTTTNVCAVYNNGNNISDFTIQCNWPVAPNKYYNTGNLGILANSNDIVVAVNLNTKQFWIRFNNGDWNSNNSTNDPATNLGGASFSSITLPTQPLTLRNDANIGTVTVLAGKGSIYNQLPLTFPSDVGAIDGIGTNAAFSNIIGLDIDYTTSTLYVLDIQDSSNYCLRKVNTTTAQVTTLCSIPFYFPSGNTNASSFGSNNGSKPLIYHNGQNAVYLFDNNATNARMIKITNLTATPVITSVSSATYPYNHTNFTYNKYNQKVYSFYYVPGWPPSDSSDCTIYESSNMTDWSVFMSDATLRGQSFTIIRGLHHYDLSTIIFNCYGTIRGLYKIDVNTKVITVITATNSIGKTSLGSWVGGPLTINPSNEIICYNYGLIFKNSSDRTTDTVLWPNATTYPSNYDIIVCDSNYNVYAVFPEQRSIIKIKS